MSDATDLISGELRDVCWEEISSLLPPPSTLGRRRSIDSRKIVAAIRYQWRTRCAWRKLPPEFQPWPTIYGYVTAWRRDGTLRKLRPLLDPRQREHQQREHQRGRLQGPLPEKLNPCRELRGNAAERNHAIPAESCSFCLQFTPSQRSF